MFVCVWSTVGSDLFLHCFGILLAFLTRLARNEASLPLGFIYLIRQSLLPVS